MAKNENNNALFILGLIFGALIASAILLTSTEDKQKIINKIKDKFKDLFGEADKLIDNSRDVINHVSTKSKKIIKKTNNIIAKNIVKPIQKISVDLPKGIESLNLTPKKEIKPKKVFKKSK